MTLNRRDYYSAIPQLEAKLSNLSKYITVEEGKIQIKIEDLYGNVSTLTQTAEEITGRVEEAETNISSLTIRADGIEQEVTEKAKTWTSQPVPPYTYGDIWTDGSDIYVCTYTRASGSFVSSDWSLMSDYTDDTTALAEAATRTTMIRSISGGTLTCYQGGTYGVFVNANGSVDIVSLTWNGSTPSKGSVYASYSSTATIGLSSSRNIYVDSNGINFRNGSTSLARFAGTATTGATLYMPPSSNTYILGTSSTLTLSSGGTGFFSSASRMVISTDNGSLSLLASGGNMELYVENDYKFALYSGQTILMDTNGYHMRFPYAWSDTIGTKNLMINSNGGIGIGSSMRHMKMDITPVLSEDLDPHRLYDVEVVQFKYKPEYDDIGSFDEGKDQIGFIAEDVSKAYPICAFHDKDGTPRNWNERTMIPAMVKLIQEQHAEIEELKRRLS